MSQAGYKASSAFSRSLTIDRHVSVRLRQHRLMLGLTQQQLAELIGVTYQQAYKYEKGSNRITSGRLFALARALGVEVSYFFNGVSRGQQVELSKVDDNLLELMRNIISITSSQQQKAMCDLVRAFAHAALDEDDPAS